MWMNPPRTCARFWNQPPPPFPIVRDAGHKLVEAADVAGMPTAFLIDRKGIIREVHHGFRPKDEAPLAARLAGLLAGS